MSLFSLCKFTCRGIFVKTFYQCISFSTRYFIHFRTVPLLILAGTTVGGVNKKYLKRKVLKFSVVFSL